MLSAGARDKPPFTTDWSVAGCSESMEGCLLRRDTGSRVRPTSVLAMKPTRSAGLCRDCEVGATGSKAGEELINLLDFRVLSFDDGFGRLDRFGNLAVIDLGPGGEPGWSLFSHDVLHNQSLCGNEPDQVDRLQEQQMTLGQVLQAVFTQLSRVARRSCAGRSGAELRLGFMIALTALHPVHSLSILPADSPLRERQILMLQQALHNARVITLQERLTVIQRCTGRPITSLREVRQNELRPILTHVDDMAAASREATET